MQPTDKIIETTQERLSSSYGAGAQAVHWQAILAALMTILNACLVSPVAATIRQQSKRPIMAMKMFRQFRQAGLNPMQASRAVTAVVESIDKAKDEEISMFVQAGQESD